MHARPVTLEQRPRAACPLPAARTSSASTAPGCPVRVPPVRRSGVPRARFRTIAELLPASRIQSSGRPPRRRARIPGAGRDADRRGWHGAVRGCRGGAVGAADGSWSDRRRGASRWARFRPGLPAAGSRRAQRHAHSCSPTCAARAAPTGRRSRPAPGAAGRRRRRRCARRWTSPPRGPGALGRRLRCPHLALRTPASLGGLVLTNTTPPLPRCSTRPTARTRRSGRRGGRRDRRRLFGGDFSAATHRGVQPVVAPFYAARARGRPRTALALSPLSDRGRPVLLQRLAPRYDLPPPTARHRRPGAGRRPAATTGSARRWPATIATGSPGRPTTPRSPGAGHFPFAEEPAAFLGAVTPFLAGYASRHGLARGGTPW